MLIVVAYDITSTRRRNRVAKILSRHGVRVNLSVFECRADSPEFLAGLQKELGKAIKPKLDHVRYYSLCKSCREKTIVQGAGPDGLFDGVSLV